MLDLVFGGRHLVFASPLSLEEAARRLEREIVPPSVRMAWRRPMEYRAFEKRQQLFIGTFADGRFHMVRLIRGRGSIRPWIDGKLSRAVSGCRVDVRLKMPAIAIVACIPFMALGVFALLFKGLFVLWGLFVVMAPGIAWSIEARKATTMLAALFESAPSRSIAEGPSYGLVTLHMLDLLFGARNLIFESPLTLEEATRRLHNELAAPEWGGVGGTGGTPGSGLGAANRKD